MENFITIFFFIIVAWFLFKMISVIKKLRNMSRVSDEKLENILDQAIKESKEDKKICYRCNRNLPLSRFRVTENKHILKMDSVKGRCFSCSECVEKLNAP